eukprot:5061505-Prymnesium_polylepis.1
MDHCIRAGDKYFKPATHEAVEPAEAVVVRTIAQLGAAPAADEAGVASADGSCLKPEVLQRVRDILDRLTPSVPSLHTDVAGFERLCIEGDLAWTKVEYIRHLVAQEHALLPYSQDLPDGAFYRGLPPMTARKFTSFESDNRCFDTCATAVGEFRTPEPRWQSRARTGPSARCRGRARYRLRVCGVGSQDLNQGCWVARIHSRVLAPHAAAIAG